MDARSIIIALSLAAALLAALTHSERRRRGLEGELARAYRAAAEAVAEARQQGYAEGLTEGYSRGRHDLRSAVERARSFGYAEGLADQDLLASEEGGE
jgi:flagellar biosynthesis/type III secretory pathway protein FliH